MKKVLTIGDIHGRTDWEKMVLEALKNFYHIVFLGDYVDSFNIRPVEIFHNLKKIAGYKRKYPDRITLLLGNHDFAYIDEHYQTSGYNFQAAMDYRPFFLENHEIFDVAWGYTNPATHKYTLFTHAGLTLRFYNNYVLPLLKDPESALYKLTEGKGLELDYHEILNFMRNEKILWKVGNARGGMGTPGPLWADYNELVEENMPGINQVFGHTATGTLSISIQKDDLLVKVDGDYGDKTANILLTL